MSKRSVAGTAIVAAGVLLFGNGRLQAQDTPPVREVRDSVSVQFVEADLRTVIQALARFLRKPVLIAGVPGVRVSLETPAPIPRAGVQELLRGVMESQGMELVEDSAFFRVRSRPAEPTGPPPNAAQLGAQTQRGPVQLFVVRLRHARAADVAATVNQLFGGSGEFASASGLSSGTLSDELRRNVVPPAAAPPAPGAAGAEGAQRGASLRGPVTIVPDEITNALLVRASSEDFHVIEQAVNELDIRPLQVLIEVLIVEARRDKTFSLGADLFAPTQRLGAGDAQVGGTVTGGGLGDLVIRLLNLGSADVNATIRAAESRGNVEIISRPVLLASNNTEARLLVGSQRPFVQVSRSLPTDTPTRDQVVQYRDVGTRLVVRPTINHDGYVSLQIQQEVNAATSETQFDAPIISTREAATRVLVRDGQTVVLGGLRDVQRDATQGGVPLLSRIPILGGLFGRADRRNASTELYLFITPRILRTDADADSVTAPRLPRERREP